LNSPGVPQRKGVNIVYNLIHDIPLIGILDEKKYIYTGIQNSLIQCILYL